MTREAHKEEVHVREELIEGEVRGVATDDFVARRGEGGNVRVDFHNGMREKADELSSIKHAASASAQFNGEIVAFAL